MYFKKYKAKLNTASKIVIGISRPKPAKSSYEAAIQRRFNLKNVIDLLEKKHSDKHTLYIDIIKANLWLLSSLIYTILGCLIFMIYMYKCSVYNSYKGLWKETRIRQLYISDGFQRNNP